MQGCFRDRDRNGGRGRSGFLGERAGRVAIRGESDLHGLLLSLWVNGHPKGTSRERWPFRRAKPRMSNLDGRRRGAQLRNKVQEIVSAGKIRWNRQLGTETFSCFRKKSAIFECFGRPAIVAFTTSTIALSGTANTFDSGNLSSRTAEVASGSTLRT